MRDNAVLKGLQLLCPRRYCHDGVTEITVDELVSAGVQAVLLDLDNTLVGWQRLDISPSVRAWLMDLDRAGLKLCLISNTRFGRRLRLLSEELGIPYVRKALKPGKKGFLKAMEELGVDPSNTVMVGDQMFTDVLGGNRVGVYTVMVRPMARHEFFGTKISRVAERVLLKWFKKSGSLDMRAGAPRV